MGTSSGSSTVQEKVKIYMLAQETSQHQLSITASTISLQMMTFPDTATCANKAYAARSRDVATWDPAMALLGHRLQEYLLDNQLQHERRAYNRTDLQPLPFVRIRMHKHGVLAADCPWDPDQLTLQTIRANNRFHGKPFFDFVTVRVAATPPGSRTQRTTEEYAQLLLLFSISTGQDDNGKKLWSPHAYVKWFKTEQVTADDPLVKAGAVLLTELREYDPAERQLNRRQQHQGAGSSNASKLQSCGIVPLSSMIRREYVMKDYSRQGGWIKNPFEY